MHVTKDSDKNLDDFLNGLSEDPFAFTLQKEKKNRKEEAVIDAIAMEEEEERPIKKRKVMRTSRKEWDEYLKPKAKAKAKQTPGKDWEVTTPAGRRRSPRIFSEEKHTPPHLLPFDQSDASKVLQRYSADVDWEEDGKGADDDWQIPGETKLEKAEEEDEMECPSPKSPRQKAMELMRTEDPFAPNSASLRSRWFDAKCTTIKVPGVVKSMELKMVGKKADERVSFSKFLDDVRGDLVMSEQHQFRPAIGFLCALHFATEHGYELERAAEMKGSLGDFSVVVTGEETSDFFKTLPLPERSPLTPKGPPAKKQRR